LQLEEAVGLAEAVAGWRVADSMEIALRKVAGPTFLTSGKLAEVAEHISRMRQGHSSSQGGGGGKGKGKGPSETRKGGCDAVFLNTLQLTPRQQERLSAKLGGVPVYDRFGVILDIFASRATTREARLQVALARLSYDRARLVRGIEAGMDRQSGAQGALGGGGGETRVERDRRQLSRERVKIERELEAVKAHRAVLRQRNAGAVPGAAGPDEGSSPDDASTAARATTVAAAGRLPVVAVVGYTNAGKTALVRALSGDETLKPQDQLFATLDTATRAVRLPSGAQCLMVDTVGFISDLPHQLVDAFAATLEDVAQADLLLHITDASDPDALNQQACVIDVLRRLGIPPEKLRGRLCVMNKADIAGLPASWSSAAPPAAAGPPDAASTSPSAEKLRTHVSHVARLQGEADAVCDTPPYAISVLQGTNMERLVRDLDLRLMALRGARRVVLAVPPVQGELVSLVHRLGDVQRTDMSDDGAELLLEVILSEAVLAQILRRGGDDIRLVSDPGEAVEHSVTAGSNAKAPKEQTPWHPLGR
jgi:50S ribosomal subunit-associated GTPase HflX